jgi:Ser/Thr protein kinase RdoA (MazF antagonist)
MDPEVSRNVNETPYSGLTPDVLQEGLAELGFLTDGRLLALNSYENRVYQVGIEDAEPVVVKVYRPGRWTRVALEEEHSFALELAAAEVPVVAPLVIAGRTLHEIAGFQWAVYPRRGGRWPELGTAAEREWMGRFVGRLHRVGRAGRFASRPKLSPGRLGDDSIDFVLDGDWLPDYLVDRYEALAGELVDRATDALEAIQPGQLRIHGDCHRGNVLWTDAGPHFVDLDDCMTGPAIQDLWMLLDGEPEQMRGQLRDLLAGYEVFTPFDAAEVRLIEPLRALRVVHYEAWLARRWGDPAFPKAFPWFAEPRHWERHVSSLEDCLRLFDAPPLW